jgi:hypothetical protein
MKRRDFLKLFGAAAVAPLLPAIDAVEAMEPEKQLWICWWQKVDGGEWEFMQFTIDGELYTDGVLMRASAIDVGARSVVAISHEGGTDILEFKAPGANTHIALLRVSVNVPQAETIKMIYENEKTQFTANPPAYILTGSGPIRRY